jgi:hypothetical protein
MNHLVTLGFWLLLAALGVALDGSLALRAIDRLAQSEGYTDIQNVMTVTNAPIRFYRLGATVCVKARAFMEQFGGEVLQPELRRH